MSSAINDWGWTPEPKRSLCQRVRLMLYNPDNHSVLGRNARSWGIVLSFYAAFYLVLALMFAACMGGLNSILDDDRPYRILSDSLIGNSPGVSARPREYITNSSTDELRNFLAPYDAAPWYKELKGCKPEDEFRSLDAPCLYVKVNRIFDWVPDCYDVLPETAPEELRTYVTSLPASEQQQVWVSCAAENGNATFAYPWGRGLRKQFFPYHNQPGYLSPLVAVQITNVNQTVAVRCRAWARNIKFNPSLKTPEGFVRVFV